MNTPSLILATEDAAAFTTLLESLTAEYQPETQGQQITVNEAARAAWELARANCEFDKSQHALYREQKNMRDWNPTQQSEFERMLRYRTRAERAYGRAFKAVEHLRKLHLQAEQRAFWETLQQEHLSLSKQRLKHSEARTRKALEAKPPAKQKDPEPSPIRWLEGIPNISQLIRIRLKDGIRSVCKYIPRPWTCCTARHPPNPKPKSCAASNFPTAFPPITPGSTARECATMAPFGSSISGPSKPGAPNWPAKTPAARSISCPCRNPPANPSPAAPLIEL